MSKRRNLMAALALSVVLAACGSGTGSPAPSTSPPGSPSPTPVACSTGGPASSSWIAPDKRTSTTPPIVSVSVSGDTLTLTFDGGTPAFELTRQPSAHFPLTGGQGGRADLAGSAGVLIILRGFRGDVHNYTGQKDFKPQGPVLLEVEELGDFEGVVGWGAGLSAPGCAAAAMSASALTFTFIRAS